MVPAFTNIRAVSAGAYGMQVLAHYKISNPGIGFAIGPLHFHPVRQPLPRSNAVFQELKFLQR
jgi:hypothetical protein